MAKIIKYKFLSCEVNHGTEEAPNMEQIILDVIMPLTVANEEIAKVEAINGEYTIEDDGRPEPSPAPAGEPVTWAELDAAYQEGVDSV